MYYLRTFTIGWRRTHNSSFFTFLVYLNWASTLVTGGLSLIPVLVKLVNGCHPKTEVPFTSSWIELFTFGMMLLQSLLITVLTNKLDSVELVKAADKIGLIYHAISLIMPVMFLIMTNVMTKWMIEASKGILQYHFAQKLANTYYGSLKIGSTGFRSCHTRYFLDTVQIFVALSVLTPFVLYLLEVIIPPGIREAIMVPRPIRPPQIELQGRLTSSSSPKQKTLFTTSRNADTLQLWDHRTDGQRAGSSFAR